MWKVRDVSPTDFEAINRLNFEQLTGHCMFRLSQYLKAERTTKSRVGRSILANLGSPTSITRQRRFVHKFST